MTPFATLTEPVSMGAWGGVCRLPKDLPGGSVESAPRSPRNPLSRGHQDIGEMIVVPDLNINTFTIRGGAPLDASQRTAWPNRCAPNDGAVIGIKCPINTALLAKANDITQPAFGCPIKHRTEVSGRKWRDFAVQLWRYRW